MLEGSGPIMRSRGTPWDLLALLGAILWPIGHIGFGGFEADAGAAVIAAGCLVVVGSLGTEFALRSRRARADRVHAA